MFYYKFRLFAVGTEVLVRMTFERFKRVDSLYLSSKCLRQSRFKRVTGVCFILMYIV